MLDELPHDAANPAMTVYFIEPVFETLFALALIDNDGIAHNPPLYCFCGNHITQDGPSVAYRSLASWLPLLSSMPPSCPLARNWLDLHGGAGSQVRNFPALRSGCFPELAFNPDRMCPSFQHLNESETYVYAGLLFFRKSQDRQMPEDAGETHSSIRPVRHSSYCPLVTNWSGRKPNVVSPYSAQSVILRLAQ